MVRTILHYNLDSFYVSDEGLYRIGVKTVPMEVCGDVESRCAFISAKDEHAKKFDIVTAETVWQGACL